MKSEETWKYIHAERADMATTWASLTSDQWATPSWCVGWAIKDTASHVLWSAELTPTKFFKDLAKAGFNFNVFADRRARRLSTLSPEELVRRLQARTNTTNHPPAPVIAMLAEIVVHGEDIRRPLGLTHASPSEALVAVADNWKHSDFFVGSKKRSAGLKLRANDVDWVHGEGPEVSGPLISLICAMGGRKGAHADLTGKGVAILAARD